MAIGKAYLKMVPQSDRFPNGSFVRWDGGIVDRTANYLSSEYGSEAANAWFLPKPDYIAWSGGALLHSVTVHYVYSMSRTSGSHLFALKGHYASLKENVEIVIYGSDSASGTVNDKCTKESTYGYDLYPYLWDRVFGYPAGGARYGGPNCRQGTYAYGCQAAVSDFYLTIEFTPATAFITTEEAFIISATSVTGNGIIEILPEGWFTERGFEYYKDGEPDNIQTVSENGGSEYGTGAYSLPITGLETDVKYYYRARASNGTVEIFGDWVEFTPTAVGVTTEAASSIGIEAAIEIEFSLAL